MSPSTTPQDIPENHAPPTSQASATAAASSEQEVPTHWVSRAAFPLCSAGLVLSQVALGFCVYWGLWWLAVPLILATSHFMHGGLIGFHEASHGLLRKNKFLNDADGVLAGTLSFMSFTLYRAAHQTHHMHLATERDEELWPFTHVHVPRWGRRLAAFVELNAGLFFTPFLFWRMFLRKGSIIRSPKVRRRVWAEGALIVGFWTAVVSAVAYWNVWNYFLWLFFVPAVIAGNLQSWRKYIEHVGLSGHTARSATRSIICDTWTGRFLSVTLLHEPLHGVHHLRSGLPHYELPHHTASLTPVVEGELTPFPNYRSAIRHLLGTLSDPRVGSHWPSEPDHTPPPPAAARS
jgi:fatty acid desaturase